MGDTHYPAVLLILPLIGAVAYIAVHNLWTWLGRRGESLYLWVAAWCAGSLLYLVSHYLQVTSATPERAVLGGRAAWMSAISLVPLVIGLSDALARRPTSRRVMVAVTGVTVALLAMLWLTGVFVSDRVSLRTDLLGQRYLALVPGPLLPLFVPYLLLAFAYCFRTVWRATSLAPAEKRVILASFVAYVLSALNDVLHAARIIQSLRVFDYAFVGVGVALTYLLVRRSNRLYAHLEEEVAARSADLHARQAALAALVDVNRAVAGSLDIREVGSAVLDATERLLPDSACHLWMLEPGEAELRLVLERGMRTPPPGGQEPRLRVGEGLAGMVAAMRQSLTSVDLRKDPRWRYQEWLGAEELASVIALPLVHADTGYGTLNLFTRTRHEFTADEVRLLESFAGQAAAAFANARLYAAAAVREKRLATLGALTQSLTATLRLDEVLNRVVSCAVELFGSSISRLWLVDEGGYSLGAHAGVESGVVGLTRLALGEGLVGEIVATRAPRVVEQLGEGLGVLNLERLRAEGVVSLAGAPLVREDRVLGALVIAVRERRRFSDEDISLLQSLANHAAIAVENARLYGAEQERARELAALRDVQTVLVSTRESLSVLDAIADWAVRLIGGQGSIVFEFDRRDGLLHPRTMSGLAASLPRIALRPGQGGAGVAVLTRKPVWSPDVESQPFPGYEDEALGQGRPLAEVVRESPYRALLAVPIIGRDEILGAITLVWAEVHSPEEGEIRLLTALAQHAAVALENAHLYEELEGRLARLATLTRLNRLISSSLDTETALREIARSAAELMDVPGTSFWLSDETSHTLTLTGFSDPTLESDFPVRSFSFGEGVMGWVATHRRPLAIDDCFADSRLVALDWWRRHRLRSFYAVPVILEGSLLAVLALNGRQPFRFHRAEEELLDAFVAQAALAIHNAASYEAEARARREAELALSQVRQLQGMLPICAYCKKVRNDRNYWEQIETYIGERSQATFSHGICPECREKIVEPQLEEWRRRQKKQSEAGPA